MEKKTCFFRDGKLVIALILRKATKEEGYGRGFIWVRYTGSVGTSIEEVVHKSLLR